MTLHYLEIVTHEVDRDVTSFEAVHGLVFGAPDAALGGARTAQLPDGPIIGIRAPMHDAEEPATRRYVLTGDIGKAVQAAEAAGAEIAVPPLEIPGHGTIALYVLGGLQYGLWQL